MTVVAAVGALSVLVSPAAAQTLKGPARAVTAGVVPAAAPARPKAWILVDADRGVVLDAGNEHEPLPPASLTKLLTALVAASKLTPTDTMTVSARAAGEPAHKISMQEGQVWNFQDALYSLLLSSANDAAAAIGERVSGSLEEFSLAMQKAGTQLGLQDSPVLHDPAGLDDNFSVDGGNLLSARDLAIVMRAVLNQPLLAQVDATPVYEFTGPDGVHHKLGNHNQLLRTYPGTVGGKTGYTSKSGQDLVAAARRNGRTMIAVVMGAPNLWKNTTDLLDQGFASPVDSTGTGDVLPAVRLPADDPPPAAAPAPAPAAAPPRVRTAGLVPHHHLVPGSRTEELAVMASLFGLLVVAFASRRRQVMNRRRRRHARRTPVI